MIKQNINITIIILGLLLFGFISKSQTTDVLNNLYTKNGATLTKTNASNHIFEYKNQKYGSIYSFDVSNPFQILVFHSDFNTCVFLDDKLSEKIILNLDIYNINAKLVCSSGNNGIWIYDDLQEELIHFDIKFNNIDSRKFLGITEETIFIFEQENFILLGTKEFIYIFDNFCVLQSKFKIKTKIYWVEKNIIKIKNKQDTFLFKNGKFELSNF